MKLTDKHKDFLASIGVAVLSMVLFVLLMGSVVMWGQSTGEKVRAKLSNDHSQTSSDDGSSGGTTSQ
jgi:hypothetical protein